MVTSGKAANRLKRALQRSQKLTTIPIEVFILADTRQDALVARLNALAKRGILRPGQAIIGVDPVNRHVALGLTPELEGLLERGEIRAWLHGLQEDLHMTALENALSLAVLSLAMAFSKKFPSQALQEELSRPPNQ
jgi:hypothetical protein